MRSHFSIRHYKNKDWRYVICNIDINVTLPYRWAFKCKDCQYCNDSTPLTKKIEDLTTEVENLSVEVIELEKHLTKEELQKHEKRKKLTTLKTKLTKSKNRLAQLPKHKELISYQREYEKKVKASFTTGIFVVILLLFDFLL